MSMFGRIEDFPAPESDPVRLPEGSLFERLVTIAIFRQPFYAYVSKTVLDSEGIECFISDDRTSGPINLFARVQTGCRLRVRESDVKRAVEALLHEPAEE